MQQSPHLESPLTEASEYLAIVRNYLNQSRDASDWTEGIDGVVAQEKLNGVKITG